MLMEMLKSKLHQACITDGDVHYEGSLGIDIELMEMVGLVPYEKILVSNINNGHRFETYAIAEPFGSKKIVLNGAAARLGAVEDRIIIMSFCQVESKLVHDGKHRPKVIRLNERNEPVSSNFSKTAQDEIASMIEG